MAIKRPGKVLLSKVQLKFVRSKVAGGGGKEAGGSNEPVDVSVGGTSK